MDNVNHLLEGATPYSVMQNQAAKLSSKWEKSGLLEGIANSTEQNNMAILLENQAKQLVNEASSVGVGAQDTNITTGAGEAWAGVALPLVRRVFGEIVAKDLVSVQPMSLPAGLIFYLDFKYGQTAQNKTADESLYGASTDLTRTDGAFNKGLYGAGEFAYSTTSSLITDVAIGGSAWASSSAVFQGILQGDTEFSQSMATENSLFDAGAGTAVKLHHVRTVAVPLSSMSNYDADAVRAWNLSVSGLATLPQYTRINGSNVEFVVSGTLGSAGQTLGTGCTVTYTTTPDNLNDRGDFEDSTSGTTGGQAGVSALAIPEINVQLRSDTVAAKTRKLKAQWTPEFAQDLNAYHSIDAEAELTSILSEYISMEIDLEILDMLIKNADTVEGWSAKIAQDVSISSPSNNTTAGGTNAVTMASEQNASGVYYTKMSWFQTLGVKLQKVSNLIHQKTLRGGANWLVCGPKVSTVLESIPGFAADSPGDQDKYNMGVQKVGAINSRYTVYKNPYMVENVILMGYKGSQFLETGAVFAPYIPLIMTPLVYDPVSFTPRKGIMTRYAKKMVRPDFYGKVYIQDIDDV